MYHGRIKSMKDPLWLRFINVFRKKRRYKTINGSFRGGNYRVYYGGKR